MRLFNFGRRQKKRAVNLSNRLRDPFAEIFAATNSHRSIHRCKAHPFQDGALLAVMARITNAKRILEVGTALGYSALWFSLGGRDAVIETIESDPEHVRLARKNFATFGVADRTLVHEGDFASVQGSLRPFFDVIFFDGLAPRLQDLEFFTRLVRPGGVLITGNLHVRGDEKNAYCDNLFGDPAWLSTVIGSNAISVRTSDIDKGAR